MAYRNSARKDSAICKNLRLSPLTFCSYFPQTLKNLQEQAPLPNTRQDQLGPLRPCFATQLTVNGLITIRFLYGVFADLLPNSSIVAFIKVHRCNRSSTGSLLSKSGFPSVTWRCFSFHCLSESLSIPQSGGNNAFPLRSSNTVGQV